MSVYKIVSSNRIIAKVYRDFKPSNSAWIPDAIEWIGEAIDIMKINTGFIKDSKEYPIIDHKVKIPCWLQVLYGVEFENKRLPRTGAVNKRDLCSCQDNAICTGDEGYILNPGYIFTPAKEGCVKLHGLWLDVDCDGFPNVIDHPFVHEAMTWYIMRMMCLRGHKHSVVDFKTCDFEWEKYYPKAQNACRLIDIDDYEVFKKSWLGLVKKTNLTNEFFNNVSVDDGSFNTAVAPGTLVPNSLTVNRNQLP